MKKKKTEKARKMETGKTMLHSWNLKNKCAEELENVRCNNKEDKNWKGLVEKNKETKNQKRQFHVIKHKVDITKKYKKK